LLSIFHTLFHVVVHIYSRLHYDLSLESSQMIRNYIFKSLKLRKNVLNLLILHLLIMPSNLPTSANYPSDLQLPTNLNLDQKDWVIQAWKITDEILLKPKAWWVCISNLKLDQEDWVLQVWKVIDEILLKPEAW